MLAWAEAHRDTTHGNAPGACTRRRGACICMQDVGRHAQHSHAQLCKCMLERFPPMTLRGLDHVAMPRRVSHAVNNSIHLAIAVKVCFIIAAAATAR